MTAGSSRTSLRTSSLVWPPIASFVAATSWPAIWVSEEAVSSG